MSRLKRWLNMHQRKVNLDGTIKEEHRQQVSGTSRAHPQAEVATVLGPIWEHKGATAASVYLGLPREAIWGVFGP